MLEGVKKFFWRLLEPFFPTIRDAWVFLGFMEHNYRQPYYYGRMKPDRTAKDLRQTLTAAGFTDDYLAWIDPGEVLNLRRFDGRMHQYHVRLFEDGEVRAHHEYTAESHPFRHLFEVGMSRGEGYLRPLLAPILDEAGEELERAGAGATLNPK